MSINAEKKTQLIKEYGASHTDTGSTQAQCAILTERINYLTSHLATHPKDFSSRRGLLKLVSQRRSLTGYLKSKDADAYGALIKKLNIRK